MNINFSIGKLKVEIIKDKNSKYYFLCLKNTKDNTTLKISLREREFALLNKFLLQSEMDIFIKENKQKESDEKK